LGGKRRRSLSFVSIEGGKGAEEKRREGAQHGDEEDALEASFCLPPQRQRITKGLR